MDVRGRRAPARIRIRWALLGTVAMTSIGLGTWSAGLAAPGVCTALGDMATCTGDHSDGISSGTDFDPGVIRTLIVQDLTTDIAPAAGQPGILFSSDLDIAIRNDPGDVAIVTSGGAAGIVATSDLFASIEQAQFVSQWNQSEQDAVIAVADPGGEAFAVQVTNQANQNQQISDNEVLPAGTVAVENTAEVFADGKGISATSSAAASLRQSQDADHQSKSLQSDAIAVSEDATAGAVQAADQSNANEQAAVIGDVSAGHVAIDNTENIAATGDGLFAASDSGTTVEQMQVASQQNDAT